MVKQKLDLLPEDLDLLNWAFDLNARVPLNWSIAAQRLSRAAVALHKRGQAARCLKSSIFSRDDSGFPIARPEPLTPEEHGLLPDVEMHRVAFMLLGMAIEDLAK